MNCARNCENLLNFVKVIPKTLLVPFFSGHGVFTDEVNSLWISFIVQSASETSLSSSVGGFAGTRRALPRTPLSLTFTPIIQLYFLKLLQDGLVTNREPLKIMADMFANWILL